MKREYLIVIAVVVVVLLACACFGGIAVWVLWPEPEPVYNGDQHYGSDGSDLAAIDLLPGVWECVDGTTSNPEGTAYQFFVPDEGMSGTVYVTGEADSGEEWIEAEYELGASGYLTISPVSYGLWAVSSSYAIEFEDTDTMFMQSMDAGDEGEPAARFERVE